MSSSSTSGVDWSAFGAIGSFLAVVVALLVAFIPSILRRWNSPAVNIEFLNEAPYCRYSPTTMNLRGTDELGMGYWVRLRIQNTGKSVLRACEGRLEAITNVANGETEHDFDPVVLHWVGHAPGAIDINKNEHEFLDVFFVWEHVPTKYIIYAEDMTPKGIALVRAKKHVRLDGSIYARNVNPVTFQLDVDFDKMWYECKINGTPNSQAPPRYSLGSPVPYIEPTTASTSGPFTRIFLGDHD